MKSKIALETRAWSERMLAAGCDTPLLAMQKCEVKDKDGLAESVQLQLHAVNIRIHNDPENFWDIIGDALALATMLGGHLEREGLL